MINAKDGRAKSYILQCLAIAIINVLILGGQLLCIVLFGLIVLVT